MKVMTRVATFFLSLIRGTCARCGGEMVLLGRNGPGGSHDVYQCKGCRHYRGVKR